jgi:LPXTG-motif cell wall-anchored protein
MTTKITNKNIFIAVTGFAILALLSITVIYPAITSASGPTINKGTTSTYGVLAATAITNTGATSITGTAGSDMGMHPNDATSFTNSGTIVHTGADHFGDAAAGIAKTDLITAYDDLSTPSSTTLSATDITGQTFTPGSYNSGSEISIANAGNITFDAQGDPSAVFIMKAVSTVITGTTSTMTLTGGAQACNVYWQVGSSATLGVNSSFIGHIYAYTSITANTGATIYGQLLARGGAVTLDHNTIVNNNCDAIPTPTPAAPQEAPAPLQDSVINSVSTSECTTTEDYKIYLNGLFPSAIKNIAINSTNISASQWSQTSTWVGITIPKTSETVFTIELFNGRMPLMPVRVFTCIPPEPITISVLDTATIEGGELPNTSSNNFNYLLLGAVLVALGGAALLLNRRNKK